jgi:hypothetical protein
LACLGVFSSDEFCGCLSTKRPWHISFDEYLEITGNAREFLSRDLLGVDQPIEGFKAVLAARDACTVD